MICKTCDGSGEVRWLGMSISPFSGELVRDPQLEEGGSCPDCHGDGDVLDKAFWESKFPGREVVDGGHHWTIRKPDRKDET